MAFTQSSIIIIINYHSHCHTHVKQVVNEKCFMVLKLTHKAKPTAYRHLLALIAFNSLINKCIIFTYFFISEDITTVFFNFYRDIFRDSEILQKHNKKRTHTHLVAGPVFEYSTHSLIFWSLQIATNLNSQRIEFTIHQSETEKEP